MTDSIPLTQSRNGPARDPGAKWTGFLLSLAFPGAGQLYARDPSCLLWFAGVAIIVSGLGSIGWLGAVIFFLFQLASAEHAKRTLERADVNSGHGFPVRHVVIHDGSVGNRIDIHSRFHIAAPLPEVWKRISNVHEFLCVDPFHTRITTLGPMNEAGTKLILHHCVFGLRFPRFGRMLYWHEGRGYAFSDISRHGNRRGFPHVFFFDIEPGRNDSTILHIRVRGRWTATWMPRPLRRLWLHYVVREHDRLLTRVQHPTNPRPHHPIGVTS